MANITVEVNDRLLDTAAGLFKGKSRSELVTIALVELVEQYEQKSLYDLFYSEDILIAEGYDYKAKRAGSLDGIVDILVNSEESLGDGEGSYSYSGSSYSDNSFGGGAGDLSYSTGSFGGSAGDLNYTDSSFGDGAGDMSYSEGGFGDSADDLSFNENGFGDTENF